MTFSVKQFLSQEIRRNFSSHIIRRNEIVSSNRRNTKNLGLNLALANAGLFVPCLIYCTNDSKELDTYLGDYFNLSKEASYLHILVKTTA